MIAVVTGTIWFGIAYGSPCAPLPTPEEQRAMYPEPLPSNIVVFITYNNFPQLWCAPGEYSLYGQVGLPHSCESTMLRRTFHSHHCCTRI